MSAPRTPPAKPSAKRGDDPTADVGTTGHVWDGIEELNNPLPRWWLWTLYATIIWGVVYTVAYPAWPLVDRATSGFLGWSTRSEVAAEVARFETANAPLMDRLARIAPEGFPETLPDTLAKTLAEDPALDAFAAQAGGAIFRNECSQCHGAGAGGAKGYPNLLDDDWLWGGRIEEIAQTVTHGIRNQTAPDARWSEMPAFADMLEPAQIDTLVRYVSDLSAQRATDPAGAALFADNCAACHGAEASGDRTQGAPALNDAIWLYGSAPETIAHTIREGRFGVMPEMAKRLTKAEIIAVSAYVHQLGGGE